jgi:hypothetical protein
MRKLKQHIAVLLVFSFSLGTVWQTAIILHFYAYQAEIEAEFCENIERPELNCHGQCHLSKQLKQANPIVDEYKQTENIKTNFLLLFTFIDGFVPKEENTTTIAKIEFTNIRTDKVMPFNSSIFHPPKSC